MRWTLTAIFMALSLADGLTAPAVRAQPKAAAWPAPPPAVRVRQVYTLRRCLQLAQANYPKVLEARAKLKKKRAQVWEAKTAPYSEFTATGGLTVTPTVRGTSVYSPNTDASFSTEGMGLAWQLGIEGAIPLWTFGKITSLWDAAEAQVELGVHELQREKNSIKLAVRRAYYGTQLARDAFALIGQATRRMDRYIERLERRVEEGEGDDIELLKLKMYRAELEARAIQARREESVALAGLRFLTGVSEGMDIVDAPLARARQTLGPIDRYLSAARLFRPEINMARAGVVAREAQVRLARARHYPDLALGLSAQWVQAPQVTDQRNPFVKDNANYLSLGAALVLRWKVDFLPQAARVSQAEADLEEVRATERFALGGVGVEVEEAFAEAAAAEKRMQAFGQALKFARQWLLKVQQGIDIGTFDDEDIVDPAKEYALKRFEHMNAIFDYNVALGKLELATGWDAVMVDE